MDELEEEIRTHLQVEEQENLESGMSPAEARYAALRRFGFPPTCSFEANNFSTGVAFWANLVNKSSKTYGRSNRQPRFRHRQLLQRAALYFTGKPFGED